jgi:hypothetical protein
MVLAILRKQRVRVLAAPLAAAFLAITAVVAVAPGTAHAAAARPAIAGQYCGTYGSGTTEVGGAYGGTLWQKQPPGCNDLNIIYTDAPTSGHWDTYAGALYYPGSGWNICHRGYQVLYNGTHDPITNSRAVPCTDVLAGTLMFIANGYSSTPDYVEINY